METVRERGREKEAEQEERGWERELPECEYHYSINVQFIHVNSHMIYINSTWELYTDYFSLSINFSISLTQHKTF